MHFNINAHLAKRSKQLRRKATKAEIVELLEHARGKFIAIS
jgi:hypothetical protein